MSETDPAITLPMYFPSGFAPDPAPLPFATYSARPSGDTATAVGYQPTGTSPATRMRVLSRRTTATALLPAIATYRVFPSGDRASALGSLPVGAWGSSATVSCSTTAPRAGSTRAIPFAPARATNSSPSRSASADGCGPTITDRRVGGVAGRSVLDTVHAPQSPAERCEAAGTTGGDRGPTAAGAGAGR